MRTSLLVALGLLLATTAAAQSRRSRGWHRNQDHGWHHRPVQPSHRWQFGYPSNYRWPYAYPYQYRLGSGTLHTARPARIITLPNGVRVYVTRY